MHTLTFENTSMVFSTYAPFRNMPEQPLVISSTFTADPIEIPLAFWLHQLGATARLSFAPYHQVFQQLLDPASLLAQNRKGLNILLIRLEDWIHVGEPETTHQRQAQDFLTAVTTAAQRASTPYVISFCPVSPALQKDKTQVSLFQQTECSLVAELEQIHSVYPIRSSAVMATYPTQAYYDPLGEELGHLPFTAEFFTALATILARKIYRLLTPPFKVIALDGDNTLWRGVCAEDGALGVRIDPPWQALQQFIQKQHQYGMLLCVCSKNNDADVFAVFDRHPDMILKRNHITAWRINWKSKSENLRSLAEELQLGLNSFIFLDDNPLECAEVQMHCPQVLTLQLPSDPTQIPAFLQHLWAFDHLKVTQEDQQRTVRYQQNRARERFRSTAFTLQDFLAGLELNISISPMEPQHLARVAQLTQRTNQFNMTTQRRSEHEVLQFSQSENAETLVVHVHDRFGEYGLVGSILFTLSSESLVVDTFLLSCRALGRGVEHHMLAKLAEIASAHGCQWVVVPFLPTQRNQPAQHFLEEVGQQFKVEQADTWLFRFPTQAIRNLTYIPKEDASSTAPESEEQSSDTQKHGPGESSGTISAFLSQIATHLSDPRQILRAIETTTRHKRPAMSSKYAAPRTPVEEILAGMFSRILLIEPVGVEDNFVELGGNSLQAVQLVSRVRDTFEVDLSVRTLFDLPTLAETARYIEQQRQNSEPTPKLADQQMMPVSYEDPLPLSFAQQRLWFFEQLYPETPVYNIPFAFRIQGTLKRKLLEQSINTIIDRHAVLRTTFTTMYDGQPIQILKPALPIMVKEVDLSALRLAEQDAAVGEVVREEARRSFDLMHGPLLRAALVRLSRDEFLLLIVVHHIVFDGWSERIFWQELANVYNAYVNQTPATLPRLSIQYADFAVWQRQIFQENALECQLAYWQARLAGELPVLNFPGSHTRPSIQSFRGSTSSFALSSQLLEDLNRVSREQGCTLFMTLLAIFKTLLYRYTGESDLLIGTPVANRTRSDVEELIGFFVNMVVLRTNLSDNASFHDLLTQVRHVTFEAYEHQDVPFEKVVETVHPDRHSGAMPLLQVVFVLQNTPESGLELTDLQTTPIPVDTGTAKFDLTLFFWQTDQGLRGTFEYNTDLIEAETIRRMAGHFQILAEAVVRNPEQRLCELPILTEAERHHVLNAWNATQVPYPHTATVRQLFESQVEHTPEATAIVYEGQRVTYRELNQRANQLAHYLRSCGVGPEMCVGVCLERSIEMIVGILGIVKAGAAYVPLEPGYPQERLAFMIADTHLSVLLTQTTFAAQLPTRTTHVICLDSDWEQITTEPATNPPHIGRAENLVYVMYTSGSTGEPKGVSVIHRGVVRLVKGANYANLDAGERFLQFAPISFDASTLEIWGCLLNGGQLFIFPPQTPSLEELARFLHDHHITVLWLTAGLFHQMVEMQRESLSTVRQLLAGGDVLSPFHVVEVLKHLREHACLINGYGPTENTTFTCCYPMTDPSQVKGNVPIGRPISNTQVYVLDRLFNPVPPGISGELYIGGDGLARNYWNRPDLSAERFLPDPFHWEPGARMYKTGDLVRFRDDGTLEFLGRIDDQVKIRGFRIEPGEIEVVLKQHSAVQDVVVSVQKNSHNNDKHLFAYIVPQETPPLSSAELRMYLKERLPQYMIPSGFVMLERLPLTPNGKIDRQALARLPISQEQNTRERVSPHTSTQRIILNIWTELLGQNGLGIHDDFFELGGHSLLATRIISRINESFHTQLPLSLLFESPTIADLADYIDTLQWVHGQPSGSQREQEGREEFIL